MGYSQSGGVNRQCYLVVAHSSSWFIVMVVNVVSQGLIR